mmetsp:Transcript_77/g.102  ORF Transcript_77/g.102 Transcript_77/m.102 type:complete len:423 (-) Transcript_77:34-1302(-)
MEDPIKSLGSHPIHQVKLAFLNTNTMHGVLSRRLRDLIASKTVLQLHNRMIDAIQVLDSMESFQACKVIVKPGDIPDSALVEFDLTDLNWWGFGLGLVGNREGGKAVFSTLFRNIRQKCDLTRLSWSFKPQTLTQGIELVHRDQFFKDNFKAQYYYRQGAREIDQNLNERAYGAGFILSSRDGSNFFELSRTLRTNDLDMLSANAETIKAHLPVSIKTSLRHMYKGTMSSQTDAYKQDTFYLIANEVALEDVSFHKVEFSLDSQLYMKNSNIMVQATGKLGLVAQLLGSRTVLANDLFTTRYVKGFRSLGDRLPSEVNGRYGVCGDSPGSDVISSAEIKVHFNTVSWLSSYGFLPFLYANSFIPASFRHLGSLEALTKQHRFSLGFGLGWNTPIGRIEASYSAYVLSRAGDIPSSFQVLFTY